MLESEDSTGPRPQRRRFLHVQDGILLVAPVAPAAHVAASPADAPLVEILTWNDVYCSSDW